MVRSTCKVSGERDPLRFTNFRRQLLAGNDNLFPISKTFSKVISKYYFSKKKTRFDTYKIYVTNATSNHGLGISTSTRFFKLDCKLDYLLTSKNTQRMLRFSLGNFNWAGSKKSSVALSLPQTFLNKYTTLKSGSNLRLYKLDNRRSMPIVKNLGRLSYRQYRYVKIFWNKLKNYFFKKNVRNRRKIFFKRKKVIKKNIIFVFNNVFSMYPLIPNLVIFKKFNNLSGLIETKSYVNLLERNVFTFNFLSEVAKSSFIKRINFFDNFSNVSKRAHSLHFSHRTFIFSKHESSFILFHNSIVFPYRFSFKYNLKKSYRVKKLFYSFLRPNELKKSILDSRKKLIYNKIVPLLKSSKIIFKKLMFNHRNMLSLFRKGNAVNSTCVALNSIDMVGSYSGSITLNSGNLQSGELKVPRVRFKPGYQRLWRNFRLAFSESINFKYIYQQQLTKYLMRFYRKLNQTYFDFYENDVKKVLIYSRLVPDLHTFGTFFDNRLIFMNGSVLVNKNIQVYSNDFIQLEISNWYYIFSRWLVTTTLKRNSRFKSLVFRKSLAGRYKVMKQVKQRSNYTPKWISTTRYDLSDIKTFLEVDYLTLSLFYIYNSNLFLYYTPNDLRITRYNLLRLYNWKYIT